MAPTINAALWNSSPLWNMTRHSSHVSAAKPIASAANAIARGMAANFSVIWLCSKIERDSFVP
ncbi:MAG: hypothetical protein WD690_00265 [Vicinamibacterales bacterium]